MRQWRKMTWAIVVWTGLNVWWLISYAGDVGKLEVRNQYEAAGRTIGAGIGTSFILGIWFMGFIVLALIWFMRRPNHRQEGPLTQPAVVIGVADELVKLASLRDSETITEAEFQRQRALLLPPMAPPPPPIAAADMQAPPGMFCGRCRKNLSPFWKGSCNHCGAKYAEFAPVGATS